jgi:hypothetical protein
MIWLGFFIHSLTIQLWNAVQNSIWTSGAKYILGIGWISLRNNTPDMQDSSYYSNWYQLVHKKLRHSHPCRHAIEPTSKNWTTQTTSLKIGHWFLQNLRKKLIC